MVQSCWKLILKACGRTSKHVAACLAASPNLQKLRSHVKQWRFVDFFVRGACLWKSGYGRISLGATPKKWHSIALPPDSKVHVLSYKKQSIWLRPGSLLILCQIQPERFLKLGLPMITTQIRQLWCKKKDAQVFLMHVMATNSTLKSLRAKTVLWGYCLKLSLPVS